MTGGCHDTLGARGLGYLPYGGIFSGHYDSVADRHFSDPLIDSRYEWDAGEEA
jgi:hypothetical protein